MISKSSLRSVSRMLLYTYLLSSSMLSLSYIHVENMPPDGASLSSVSAEGSNLHLFLHEIVFLHLSNQTEHIDSSVSEESAPEAQYRHGRSEQAISDSPNSAAVTAADSISHGLLHIRMASCLWEKSPARSLLPEGPPTGLSPPAV